MDHRRDYPPLGIQELNAKSKAKILYESILQRRRFHGEGFSVEASSIVVVTVNGMNDRFANQNERFWYDAKLRYIYIYIGIEDLEDERHLSIHTRKALHGPRLVHDLIAQC
ncbi:unnamed protein product [Somion occarium]|uniref:Uncharacterized protein n=1 Tax=Somion occarium TaxID=3059160 RepID=A0ABP1E554_9APHY